MSEHNYYDYQKRKYTSREERARKEYGKVVDAFWEAQMKQILRGYKIEKADENYLFDPVKQNLNSRKELLRKYLEGS